MKTVTVELGKIAHIVQGGRSGLSGNDFVEHGYPAYGAGGLNGYLDSFEYETDGVVLSSIGARCGKCFFASGRWSSLANTQVILPDSRLADPLFLWFQLNDESRWPRSGTGQPFIKPSDVKRHRLILPPLDNQRRIAAQLQQADRLRRTRRHALELADDFLPAIFRKLFGDSHGFARWPIVPFGDLISSGPQNGLYKPATSYGSGTRIVRIDAYQNGGAIDLSALKRLRLAAAEIATYGLQTGDFLINRVNSRSHLGKSTRITHMPEPMVFESNMMRFRIDETRLDPAFALHQLQTPFINRQIQKRAKDASNQASINQDDVEGLGIPLPPLARQRHFAALVARHARLRAIQQESLRQAEHLFQTLLQRAFA